MSSKICKFGFQKVIPSLFKASATSTDAVSQRTFASQGDEGICITNKEVKSFIERSMMAVGTKPSHAASLADNLTMADYRGHLSHGLNRLEMYVKDVLSGATVCDKEPVVVKETPSTGLVDGNNLLGTAVSMFCMDVAIKKAKETGIGIVAAKASNHYGIAGFYSMMASDQGLLGMTFSNTSPLVLPTRGKKACLGTNPLSLAAPGTGGDSFVLDMATSAVAFGKIELRSVKKDKIPLGWGADSKGMVTDDPDSVLNGGNLLALGGAELTSGYKGYGLAVMVEVLCGILAGAQFGPKIRKWKQSNKLVDLVHSRTQVDSIPNNTTFSIGNLGHCFIAIDPKVFADGFESRMQEMMDLCRKSDVAEGETEVMVAGDKEKKHMEKCDKAGGITYHPNVIALLDAMADTLKIERIVRNK